MKNNSEEIAEMMAEINKATWDLEQAQAEIKRLRRVGMNLEEQEEEIQTEIKRLRERVIKEKFYCVTWNSEAENCFIEEFFENEERAKTFAKKFVKQVREGIEIKIWEINAKKIWETKTEEFI